MSVIIIREAYFVPEQADSATCSGAPGIGSNFFKYGGRVLESKAVSTFSRYCFTMSKTLCFIVEIWVTLLVVSQSSSKPVNRKRWKTQKERKIRK
jgi:hypothetical protein